MKETLFSNLPLSNKLQSLTLCKNSQDIAFSYTFFEKDLLDKDEFSYLKHLYVPNNDTGFRRVPYLSDNAARFYDESFLINVSVCKAHDIIINSELPSLKPNPEKVSIYLIKVAAEISEDKTFKNFNEDNGLGFDQSLWQRTLTVLGLPLNREIIVSKPVLTYLKSKLSSSLQIEILKEISFSKKVIDLASVNKSKSPFDNLRIERLCEIKNNSEFAFNQFANIPKNESQATNTLEQNSFYFYYLQSFLLHQQLRLHLIERLNSYESISQFEIDQPPHDSQLFSDSGLNFIIFNKNLDNDEVDLNIELTRFFWHLYEGGFIFLPEASLARSNLEFEKIDNFNDSFFLKDRQGDFFDNDEKIPLDAKIYILLLILISSKNTELNFRIVSDLIDSENYVDAINTILSPKSLQLM